ncbi:MAG TPA: ABC transporter ATP-binding protein [Smithellaceae bacterium]|nr:ABC transporter ATP-binding protein [Smithellaceae bacterium]
MSALLEIDNLQTVFSTGRGMLRAVDGVSIALNAGEVTGVVGESGCGKTMLALSILRLIPPNGRIQTGRIVFEGRDLLFLSEAQMRQKRGSDIGMIFQEPMTSLNPVLRVGEQIAEVVMLHRGLPRKQAQDESVRMLAEVGLPDPSRRAADYPHQLSGGMRQRVMIAIAMSCHPKLLLADEPTTALDVTVQAQILDLMAQLQKKNDMAVMLITHDLGVVARMAHRVAVMYAGRIVEMAAAADLFENPLHPYTKGLIESRPGACGKATSGNFKLKTIAGTVPSLYALPEGCRFSDRCDFASEACRQKEPDLLEVRTNHSVACVLHQRK